MDFCLYMFALWWKVDHVSWGVHQPMDFSNLLLNSLSENFMLLYSPNLISIKALKLNSISSSVWKLDRYNQDHGMSMWDRYDVRRCDCQRDLDINGAFKFQMLGDLNVVLKGSAQEL